MHAQLVAHGFQQLRECVQRGRVAVQVFRSVAVEKTDVICRFVRRQVVGGQNRAVFEKTVLAARDKLLVFVQLDRIAPQHDAPAAGRDAVPRQPAPARGLVVFDGVPIHVKAHRLAGRAAGDIRYALRGVILRVAVLRRCALEGGFGQDGYGAQRSPWVVFNICFGDAKPAVGGYACNTGAQQRLQPCPLQRAQLFGRQSLGLQHLIQIGARAVALDALHCRV